MARGGPWLAAAVFALAAPGAFAACPGYSVCPRVDYSAVAASAAATRLGATLDAARNAAAADAGKSGVTFGERVALVGKAIVFDRGLSATGTQACASCHLPGAGFGAGLAANAPAGGVVGGAVPPRAGFRPPQSLAYAGFAPVLHWDTGIGNFFGGDFWDMRATGEVSGNPASDQAPHPFTNPAEMAFPDPGCVVRRVSRAPYAAQFALVWGAESFQIAWPADTDAVCATPGGGGSTGMVALSAADRAQAGTTLNFVAQTILAFENSALASPFTSKYDAYLAGTATLTAAEAQGLQLFQGRGGCTTCHSLGPSRPLLTDFSAHNIGVPRNPALPYLTENLPDGAGYIANGQGRAFRDRGLAATLQASPHAAWRALAPKFEGAFQTPTLRNVSAGAGRRYMHNGYFATLQMVVHFYNTRDVLPRCTGATGAGVSCWPAPETAANVNTSAMGRLQLSAAEEGAIVAFLGALTDGFGK